MGKSEKTENYESFIIFVFLVLSDYYKMNEGEKEYQIEQLREKAELSMVKNDLIGAHRELVLFLCNSLASLKVKYGIFYQFFIYK